MPRYDYECHNGHVTTEFRRFEDRNQPITCACGESAEKVWRTFPGVSFQDSEVAEAEKWGFIVREPGVEKDVQRRREEVERRRKERIRQKAIEVARDTEYGLNIGDDYRALARPQ